VVANKHISEINKRFENVSRHSKSENKSHATVPLVKENIKITISDWLESFGKCQVKIINQLVSTLVFLKGEYVSVLCESPKNFKGSLQIKGRV
jgi:hypothetical protein